MVGTGVVVGRGVVVVSGGGALTVVTIVLLVPVVVESVSFIVPVVVLASGVTTVVFDGPCADIKKNSQNRNPHMMTDFIFSTTQHLLSSRQWGVEFSSGLIVHLQC